MSKPITKMMQINGITLHVQLQGSGQPLVLLHGLASNITALQLEIDHLSREFQTIAIDSRGHGRSDKPAQYTLQDHIDDVLAVLDALGLETVYLMGTSMGSYIAQGVAIQQPDRIAKLVLLVPKSNGKTSSSARLLAEHAAELAGKSPEQIQAFLLDHIFAPDTPREVKAAMQDFAAVQADAGLVLTPEQTLAANRALEGFDFRPGLPRITAPTLVISGRYDPLNPPADGQQIADLIPNARFVVLEHSGHAATVEEPERILELLDEFLGA